MGFGHVQNDGATGDVAIAGPALSLLLFTLLLVAAAAAAAAAAAVVVPAAPGRLPVPSLKLEPEDARSRPILERLAVSHRPLARVSAKRNEYEEDKEGRE